MYFLKLVVVSKCGLVRHAPELIYFRASHLFKYPNGDVGAANKYLFEVGTPAFDRVAIRVSTAWIISSVNSTGTLRFLFPVISTSSSLKQI